MKAKALTVLLLTLAFFPFPWTYALNDQPAPAPAPGPGLSEKPALAAVYYENREGGFKLKFPAGWPVVERKSNGVLVVESSPDRPLPSFVLVFAGNSPPGPAQERPDLLAPEGYLGNFLAYSETARQDLTVAGQKARWLEFRAVAARGGASVKMRGALLATRNGRRAYLAAALAAEPFWPAEAAVLKEALLSFVPQNGG